MLGEGEVYDLGEVPVLQAEEPRQWAAFRQAVMRKMGSCSDRWQQVLRLRAGPDPVIDPREEEPEEEPVPGYRPPGEWLPSLVEPGAIRKSWGSASAEGQLDQDEKWARLCSVVCQIWWERDSYKVDNMVPSDPATWKTQGWAHNMEVRKNASRPSDFNPYLGDSDKVSSRSGSKGDDWDTCMRINGVGGVMDWLSYEDRDRSL